MKTIFGIILVILAGTVFLYLSVFENPVRRTFSSRSDMLKWIDRRHNHGHLTGTMKLGGTEVILYIDPPDSTPVQGRVSIIRSVPDSEKWELVLSADRPEKPLVFEIKNDTIMILERRSREKVLIVPRSFFSSY